MMFKIGIELTYLSTFPFDFLKAKKKKDLYTLAGFNLYVFTTSISFLKNKAKHDDMQHSIYFDI